MRTADAGSGDPVPRSPGVLVLDDVPVPGPPGPLDVLIRPEVVGICGSDLHVYSGDVAALSGARSFFPRVQGHEFSALIEETGQDCPAGLRPGDRVVVWPLRSGVFPEKEIDVVGSSCATAADFRAAARLVQAHRTSVAALLTHRFPLARAREAIECAGNATADVVKVLITITGKGSQEDSHD
ncbi:MAG TPA: alcohol dehydrogenase catalytic domain-containing protein [Streptosporangiaceae bacterium]|nr:alcohol dehydrogenase catalytic domain-containing protein [Streptosporangiaceae bacterium]